MLDIKFIRENKDLISVGAKKKHIDFDVSALIAMDDKRKAFLQETEALKAEQNKESQAIQNISDPAEREKKYGR